MTGTAPDRRRVGIDDVARRAGVSRQTVSNVLNTQGRFTQTTRVRVEAVVAELGYRPNHAARAMRLRRTATLAHPVADSELLPHNFFGAQFLQALVGAAAAAGQTLLATGSRPDMLEEVLAEGRVDGFVLADSEPGDARVNRLLELSAPFAAFGRTSPDQPQSWVDVDSRSSVRAATEHLLGLGHRHLAFLGYGGWPSGVWDVDRAGGFQDALVAAGLEPTGIERVEHEAAPAAADRLLSGHVRPTAIVCSSDILAAVVYSVGEAHGLRIGVDLAVTGFDGGAELSRLRPTLTTVRPPLADIAASLVERVLAEAAGPTGRPGLLITAPLIVGESSAPLAVDESTALVVGCPGDRPPGQTKAGTANGGRSSSVRRRERPAARS